MFAGQQPYPTWPQAALPPPDDPGSGARETESVEAKANKVPSGAGRPQALLIVLRTGLGLAALALVGFAGSLLLYPAPAPKTAAVLQQVASAPPYPAFPPLLEAAPDSTGQAIEPERFSLPEPPPIQFGVPHEASLEAAPPPSPLDAATPDVLAPLPPPRPLVLAPPRPLVLAPPSPLVLAPPTRPLIGYDKLTAIYDITAHTVYLPNGTRLEAHSGLGDRIDDPRYVDERDRGATPPHLYELTLRESLFHGVQALRLNPIGGGFSFNRVGLLAHPYMLGPNGDSNGCVSFKNYDAFLAAFQNGEVKRLAVVARVTQEPPLLGRLASLRPGFDR
jgi:hypothetical protein